jgi:hypothetical protein
MVYTGTHHVNLIYVYVYENDLANAACTSIDVACIAARWWRDILYYTFSSALVCVRWAVALASCPMHLPLSLLTLPREVRPVRRV